VARGQGIQVELGRLPLCVIKRALFAVFGKHSAAALHYATFRKHETLLLASVVWKRRKAEWNKSVFGCCPYFSLFSLLHVTTGG
jgi:hypothetical protein